MRTFLGNVEVRIGSKEISDYIRKSAVFTQKVLILFTKTSYRTAHDHPLLAGSALFLCLLYRFLPSLFAFLVSSSPVIICTTILLGTLLSFGEPNIPEIEEEKKTVHDISSLQVYGIVDDFIIKEDDDLLVENLVESRSEVEEDLLVPFQQAGGVPDSADVQKEEPSSLENYLIDSRDINSTELVFDEVKDVSGNESMGAHVSVTHDEEESKNIALFATCSEIEGDKPEVHVEGVKNADKESSKEDFFEEIYVHEEMLTEGTSQVAENVHGLFEKLDVNIGGMKAEIGKSDLDACYYSLLSSKKPANDHADSSDSGSDGGESSSPDASMADIIPMLDELHPLLDDELSRPIHVNLDDSDVASEVSSQDQKSDSYSEEADNREEEDEAQEEKDSESEVMVTWTADDEKNVMDLGSSELERNQRLESLIAKRRARKDLRAEVENLIDFNSYDSPFVTDRLSRLHVQVSPISIKRKNPFDYLYDSDLPPIPGSAPSVLLQKPNPFDFAYNRVPESDDIVRADVKAPRHPDSVPQHNIELYSETFEAFTQGASSSGDNKEENANVNFVPYFVPEQINTERGTHIQYKRQLSQLSDSKLNSVPESESASSLLDQEYRKELLEQDLHQQNELPSHVQHFEVATVKLEREEQEISLGSGNASNLISNDKKEEESCRLPTSSVKDEKEVGHERQSRFSADLQSKVVEKYTESDSSSCDDEGSTNLVSAQAVISEVSDGVDRDLVESSSFSIDDGKSSPILSDRSNIVVGKSEMGSPPKLVKQEILEMEENSILKTSFVKEDGTSLQDVAEVGAHNFIQVDSFRNPEDYPIATGVQKSEDEGNAQHTNISSVDIELGLYGTVERKATYQSDSDENLQSPRSPTDDFAIPDHLTGGISPKAPRLIDEPAVLPSDYNISESKINILPPIPEEIIADSKQGEEAFSHVVITDLQMIESSVNLSDVPQKAIILQKESAEETGENDTSKVLIHVTEGGDSSVVSHAATIQDHDFTGIQKADPMSTTDPFIHSPLNLSDSEGKHLSEIKVNNELHSTELSNDSIGNFDELNEIKEVDEELLSELDVVGDFSVGKLHSDQAQTKQSSQFYDHSDGVDMNSVIHKATQISHLQAESTYPSVVWDEEVSPNNFSVSHSFSDLPDQHDDISSNPVTLDGDIELLDDPLELHVLESGSIEDIDSGIKLVDIEYSVADEPVLRAAQVGFPQTEHSSRNLDQKDEASTRSLVHEPVSLEDAGFATIEAMEDNTEQMKIHSNMHEVEARSVEDIDMALMKLVEVIDKPKQPGEISSSQSGSHESVESSTEMMMLEQINAHSGLQEAKEQLIEDAVLELKHESESTAEKHVDQLLNDKSCLQLMEVHSELEKVEMQSLDDLNSAFESKGGSVGNTHDGQQAEIIHLEKNEAHSLDGIDIAVKHLSASTIENPNTQVIENETHSVPVKSESGLYEDEVQSIKGIDLALHHQSGGASDNILKEFSKEKDSKLVVVQSDLHEIEAQSFEDLHLAMGKLDTRPESVEIHSSLHEIEAESLQDSHLLIVKQDPHPEPAEPDADLVEVESQSLEDFRLEMTKLETHSEPPQVHSEMHEVEAQSLEDLHSTLVKQDTHPELVEVHSDLPEVEAQTLEGKHLVIGEKDAHPELMEVHSDLHEVEARSLKDLHLVMGKLETYPEPVEVHSELHEVEAESLEDLHLAMGLKITRPEPVKVQSDLHEVEAFFLQDLHLVTGKLETHPEPLEMRSEIHEIEVRSLEELHLTMGKDSHPETVKVHSDLHEVEARSLGDLHLVMGKLETHPELAEVHSELHEVEAQSLEDLHLETGKQETNLEPVEVRSNLHEVEARSLEDLRLAMIHPEPVVVPQDLQGIEARSFEDLHIAMEKHEAHPESVVHSDLHEIEAHSFDDLHIAMRKQESTCPELVVPHSDLQEDEGQSVECIQSGIQGTQSDLIVDHSDLHEVEARSLDDLHLVFKQQDPLLEPVAFYSDLHEVEARSLEDLHLAMGQVSGGASGSEMKLAEAEREPSEHKEAENHADSKFLESSNADMIMLAFQETAPVEADITSTSSSTASTTMENKNKGKLARSGSSSSSSSSSSPSDSD